MRKARTVRTRRLTSSDGPGRSLPKMFGVVSDRPLGDVRPVLVRRAGVERVMGFCTQAEYEEFMREAPEFEHMLVRSGLYLTNREWAPWTVVKSNDKKRARLEAIKHALERSERQKRALPDAHRNRVTVKL